MIEYIFDPQVQKMLVEFYTVSGLRVGIHDANMNILLEHPVKSSNYDELRFCDKVRYHSPLFTRKCRECDLRALEYAKITKKAYIYKCHAGFTDAIIPVMAEDELICALMIGQIKYGYQAEQYSKIVSFIDKDKLDDALDADLREAYAAMPVLEGRKLEALVYFLEICAQSIYDNRWIKCTESKIIENFKAYIEKNLYNKINVRHTAAALYVSVSHLSRLIASELGTTFTKYLTNRRIEEAKKLLAMTDISISELASHLCFGNASYFMKTFKKYTGMTCTEYRNAAKAKKCICETKCG